MNIDFVLFCIFGFILLFAAFRVITAKNSVIAALNLILGFANAACLWMLLQAEFLSLTLVLVYIGAVMVLFLFVVMMLDIDMEQLRQGFWQHFPFAGAVGAVVAIEMIFVLYRGFNVTQPLTATTSKTEPMSNANALGLELYTDYIYTVEIAAVILLVAIIAAIALTLRDRKDARSQSPAKQVRIKKSERLQIIKMPPVKKEAPAETAPQASATKGPV